MCFPFAAGACALQFIAFAMPCPAAFFVLSDRRRFLCFLRRPIPLGIDFGLWKQIRTGRVIVVVDVVVVVDVAVVIDVVRIVVVVAGRAEPPI